MKNVIGTKLERALVTDQKCLAFPCFFCLNLCENFLLTVFLDKRGKSPENDFFKENNPIDARSKIDGI